MRGSDSLYEIDTLHEYIQAVLSLVFSSLGIASAILCCVLYRKHYRRLESAFNHLTIAAILMLSLDSLQMIVSGVITLCGGMDQVACDISGTFHTFCAPGYKFLTISFYIIVAQLRKSILAPVRWYFIFSFFLAIAFCLVGWVVLVKEEGQSGTHFIMGPGWCWLPYRAPAGANKPEAYFWLKFGTDFMVFVAVVVSCVVSYLRMRCVEAPNMEMLHATTVNLRFFGMILFPLLQNVLMLFFYIWGDSDALEYGITVLELGTFVVSLVFIFTEGLVGPTKRMLFCRKRHQTQDYIVTSTMTDIDRQLDANGFREVVMSLVTAVFQSDYTSTGNKPPTSVRFASGYHTLDNSYPTTEFTMVNNSETKLQEVL